MDRETARAVAKKHSLDAVVELLTHGPGSRRRKPIYGVPYEEVENLADGFTQIGAQVSPKHAVIAAIEVGIALGRQSLKEELSGDEGDGTASSSAGFITIDLTDALRAAKGEGEEEDPEGGEIPPSLRRFFDAIRRL